MRTVSAAVMAGIGYASVAALIADLPSVIASVGTTMRRPGCGA